MLRQRSKLSKQQALKVRELVLADGIVSRTERKFLQKAIAADLLEADSLAIFLELFAVRNKTLQKAPVITRF